jgi:hypothetical protein
MFMMNDGVLISSDSPVESARPQRYKIALYGFGSQPIVHRYLIDLATEQNLPVSWCAMLDTPHYREIIGEALASKEILDVYRTLPRIPVGGDFASLANYPGSLAEDLAAQKWTYRRRSGQFLLTRAIDYYTLFKNFLVERGATHILMSTIETPYEKIAAATAQELGLGVMALVDMRNLTGSYFSTDCYETPPTYARATPETRAQAAEFVRRFRQNPTPAREIPVELAANAQDRILPDFMPSFWRRMARFVSVAMERPDIFDGELLRIAVMNYATPLRKIIRGTRAWRNARQFAIANVAELPERFIFYPLHLTPESSINTPAPYFVDQMRVVDMLRFAMPSDHMLVVKEHPTCVEFRPTAFMRQLHRLPGVLVIESSVPAIEIVKRAALTITVTGTATLEAFLLGRPAMALGGGLPAWATGHVPSLATLRAEIHAAIVAPPSDEFVVEQVARLLSVRYPFMFNTPHLPGEPMLRLQNLQRFLAAMLDHLQREDAMRERASQPLERSTA